VHPGSPALSVVYNSLPRNSTVAMRRVLVNATNPHHPNCIRETTLSISIILWTLTNGGFSRNSLNCMRAGSRPCSTSRNSHIYHSDSFYIIYL